MRDLDTFIKKSIEVNGNKFDYSKFEYKHSKHKSILICNVCKIEFETTPSNNLLGKGCKNCFDSSRKCDFKDMVNRFELKHCGWKYKFETYRGYHLKMEMICENGHLCSISPNHHLGGIGCQICKSDIILLNLEKKLLKNNFIIDEIQENNLLISCKICSSKYKRSYRNCVNFECDYCYVYDRSKTIQSHDFELLSVHSRKLKLRCKNGHIVYQNKVSHFKGRKCIECYREEKFFTKDKFLLKVHEVHGNYYKYNLDNFKNLYSKIEIICRNGHTFYQRASNHLQGKGCNICNESFGERSISNILEINNIEYLREYKFENCISDNEVPLRFDFYLPDHNLCIEYDGIQHFKPVKFFGGKDEYEKVKYRDRIKNDFCLGNNIRLIRISYTDNIEDKLKSTKYNITSDS